jgi:hypothetical protein
MEAGDEDGDEDDEEEDHRGAETSESKIAASTNGIAGRWQTQGLRPVRESRRSCVSRCREVRASEVAALE